MIKGANEARLKAEIAMAESREILYSAIRLYPTQVNAVRITLDYDFARDSDALKQRKWKSPVVDYLEKIGYTVPKGKTTISFVLHLPYEFLEPIRDSAASFYSVDYGIVQGNHRILLNLANTHGQTLRIKTEFSMDEVRSVKLIRAGFGEFSPAYLGLEKPLGHTHTACMHYLTFRGFSPVLSADELKLLSELESSRPWTSRIQDIFIPKGSTELFRRHDDNSISGFAALIQNVGEELLEYDNTPAQFDRNRAHFSNQDANLVYSAPRKHQSVVVHNGNEAIERLAQIPFKR